MPAERRWPAEDDRRDEPDCPPPDDGWRPPKRRVWPGTGLHANPSEFPPTG